MKNLKWEHIKKMKVYVSLVLIVLTVYVYSMFTGWRFLSFGEASHSKDANLRGPRVYNRNYFYHK